MNDATQFFDTVAGAGGYQIERSLRFNSSDSAYLSRTPASAGNRKTWTWAGWVKLSSGTRNWLFSASESVNSAIEVFSDGRFYVYHGSGSPGWVGWSGVLRDYSAWYHITVVVDTTQATEANRIKAYINGNQITFNEGNQPAQNYEPTNGINSTSLHNICRHFSGSAYTVNCYLADIHFIDGQALDPTSFGEFDTNGVWQPKAYAGSYGTNGFHLPFSDNSTAAALGTDTSGNGNTWTVNNIAAFNVTKSGAGSVTAGAPYNSSFPWTTALDGAIDLTGAVSNASGANSFVWTFANTLTGTTAAFVVHDTYVPDFDTGNKAAINGTALTSSNWTKTTNTLPVASGVPGDYKVYTYSLGGSPLSTVGVGNAVRIAAVLLDGIPVIFDVTGTNDSLVDSPTNYGTDSGAGGEVRGNYATLNPIDRSSYITVNNGNLDAANPSQGSWYMARGTIGMSSEKWYWEVTATNVAGGTVIFGIANGTASLDSFPGNSSGGHGYGYNGTLYGAGSSGDATAISSGDVIGFAFNADAGTLALYRNGALQSGSFSGLASGPYFPAIGLYTPGSCSLNFGQRPFAYTAPSGFKALCTTNLPEPTIADGSTAMDVALYTGNGSTQTISGLGFSPDLVWGKLRSTSSFHRLHDSVRGSDNTLASNATDAEVAGNGIVSFTSDGWEMDAGTNINQVYPYVAWTWDAGSSTVTNTQGSITSQVRANPGAGFSVVTYTTPGSLPGTIGHGLGVEPYMVITKSRGAAGGWGVYHKSIGNTNVLLLNGTDAAYSGPNQWNSTTPTSSVFSIGTDYATSATYVAYVFSPVAGYSSFGSYVGNGSSDGPFLFCGFRPRFYMYKRTDSTGSWVILDAARPGYNVVDSLLFPDLSNAESTFNMVDFCANGIKIRNSFDADNGNGGTFVYAAFAEHPFATARAR